MQYVQKETLQPDLLHHAFMASRLNHRKLTDIASQEAESTPIGFSEISLTGSPRQCLQWLAPVLRELSQANTPGWLTLIDPPLPVSHKWLRNAGLDPQRILIIRCKEGMDSEKLCREILELGYSHTVVSWLNVSEKNRRQLTSSAHIGRCSSLNVRMDTQAA